MPSSPEATTRVNGNGTVTSRVESPFLRPLRERRHRPPRKGQGLPTLRHQRARGVCCCHDRAPLRRYGPVQDREILEGQGHGAVHSARCGLTDADAASRGSGGSIARSGSSTGSRRRRRSSTEPSALGRHPSIVDVP